MRWLSGDQYGDESPSKKIKMHSNPPSVGDIVAIPFNDKKNSLETFWLGKCLRIKESTILIAWLQGLESEDGITHQYKMKIGASWEEVS